MANTDYTKVNVQQLADLASTIQTSSTDIQSGLTNYNSLLKSLQSSGYLEGVSSQAINQSYSKIMETYAKFAEYATEVVKQLSAITQETQTIEQAQATAWQDIVGSDPLNFGAAIGAAASAIGATLDKGESENQTTTTEANNATSENPTSNPETLDGAEESGKTMDYRMTYYYPGDECKSGTATASGLTTNDFEVNENGWYTYEGKLVVATAHESLKSWDRYSDSTQKTYELYDELTLTIDGKDYDAIVLDKCGAAMNSPKVDLFVVDKAHGLDTQIKVTEK